MRSYTVDDVMAFHPCNSREWHEERWVGREALTTLEILNMADAGVIMHSDAVWLFTRRAPDGSCACLTIEQDEAWKEVVITRAITLVMKVYAAPEYTAWANAYLNGNDRTPMAAKEVAQTARAAETAWAAEAAWAARAAWAAEAAWASWATWAARAAWATWPARAVEAAEAAENKQQVADLRAILLAWPE